MWDEMKMEKRGWGRVVTLKSLKMREIKLQRYINVTGTKNKHCWSTEFITSGTPGHCPYLGARREFMDMMSVSDSLVPCVTLSTWWSYPPAPLLPVTFGRKCECCPGKNWPVAVLGLEITGPGDGGIGPKAD